MLDYQPGNGTRYVCSFTDLRSAEGALKMFGVPEGGWIFSMPLRNVSMPVFMHGYLHWHYVSEKLKVCKADAVVLAELIGSIVGVGHSTCEEIEAGSLDSHPNTDEESDDMNAALA